MAEHASTSALPKEQLHILRHTLGVGEDGCGTSHRNHFVTGAGGPNHVACTALVAAGLMTRHKGGALSGGDDVFSATPSGRAAAVGTPPKLTRSQQRYREYLRTDSNLSFIDWLRSPYSARTVSLANVQPPRNLRTRIRQENP